ncbi:hypothetical protein JKP88DRAFT_285369 [Tribonema minus]|uniref:Uncharacterized protein n=1 Tax=Tribonema minus TaxID=303371 RepID=A0A835ZEB4_9STRA|nr:hypothetical protein JKP88DRAFT_285369 [Tribonema minus]
MPVELAEVFKSLVVENEPAVASRLFEATQGTICKRRRYDDDSDVAQHKFRRGSQSTLSYTPDLLYAIENHIETGCVGTASGAATPTEHATDSGISKLSLAQVLLTSAIAVTAESARVGEPTLDIEGLQPTLLLYRYADYVRPTSEQMEQMEEHYKRAVEKDSHWREFNHWRGLLDPRKFWKEIAVVALYFAAGTSVAVELETLFEVTSTVLRPSLPWIVQNEPTLATLLYEIFPGIKNHVPTNQWKRGFVNAAYAVGLAATTETPFLLQRYYELAAGGVGAKPWHR